MLRQAGKRYEVEVTVGDRFHIGVFTFNHAILKCLGQFDATYVRAR